MSLYLKSEKAGTDLIQWMDKKSSLEGLKCWLINVQAKSSF